MVMFGAPQPFRIDPKLPPELVKTYEIRAPRSTHTRPATCEEVFCGKFTNGFKLITNPSTELGRHQATYVRADRSRAARQVVEGGLVVFYYPPGTQCFAEHRAPIDREPFYLRREGDYRGNPRGIPAYQHDRPEHWVEDFAEHQERLATEHRKG